MRQWLEPQFFKRLGGFLLTIVAIYVVFLAFLVLIQRQLMYFPDNTDFFPEQHDLTGFKRLEYKTRDGLQGHGFYAPPAFPHRLTIVFFQGNAGNLSIRAEKISLWRQWGYGVMLATYRGFHGNPGTPDEQGLYEDARAAVSFLIHKLDTKPQDIIFYGESLGTGIATQMAIETLSAGVVLEVPYTSIPDVGSQRFPFVPIFFLTQDRYESIDKIRNIQAPLLILQAGRDGVIPPVLAQRLYDHALTPKTIVTNPQAGHMGIYSSVETVSRIRQFLDGINASPRY